MLSMCRVGSVLVAAAFIGGAMPQDASPSTTQAQRDALAWSAEDTGSFARFVDDFVKTNPIKSDDKQALLARAAILANHARGEAIRVEACMALGSEASDQRWRDLQARAVGLREERVSLERELTVWQVQHGLVKPEDTHLLYVPAVPGC